MTAMAKELQLSVLRISRLFAVAEAVEGGLGGKRQDLTPHCRVRQALKMAAMSLSHNGSALGAFYRRMCARMDKSSANTATAHKLARMVYFMLTRGEAYVDQGQQHYEEQQRQRSVAALRRRAAALGFAIAPTQTPV